MASALAAASGLAVASGLVVASGLARVGLRSSPQNTKPRSKGGVYIYKQPLWRASLLALGCEAAPKTQNPAQKAGFIFTSNPCGERACPRWAAQQPQKTNPAQKAGFIFTSNPRGERACSRWAAKQPQSGIGILSDGMRWPHGAASRPSASKLARHNRVAC